MDAMYQPSRQQYCMRHLEVYIKKKKIPEKNDKLQFQNRLHPKRATVFESALIRNAGEPTRPATIDGNGSPVEASHTRTDWSLLKFRQGRALYSALEREPQGAKVAL
jgi:hypothetical protein